MTAVTAAPISTAIALPTDSHCLLEYLTPIAGLLQADTRGRMLLVYSDGRVRRSSPLGAIQFRGRDRAKGASK